MEIFLGKQERSFAKVSFSKENVQKSPKKEERSYWEGWEQV